MKRCNSGLISLVFICLLSTFNTTYGDTVVFSTSERRYEIERDVCDDITVDILNRDTRHYGISWQTISNVFVPQVDDLIYLDMYFQSAHFDKIFFLWNSNSEQVHVKKKCAFVSDALYGVHVDSVDDIPESETATYIELGCKLTIQIAELIGKSMPNISIINLQSGAATEAIAFLLASQKIRYVNNDFLKRSEAFFFSDYSARNGYELRLGMSIHDKIDEMAKNDEKWFSDYYRALFSSNSLMYIDVTCASDNINEYLNEAKPNVLGVMINSRLEIRTIIRIIKSLPSLKGFIYRYDKPIYLPRELRENKKILYYRGMTVEGYEVNWSNLVACDATQELFLKMPYSRYLADVYLCWYRYNVEKLPGMLRCAVNLVRCNYFSGIGGVSEVFGGILPVRLRILRGIRLMINNDNYIWFSENIEEMYGCDVGFKQGTHKLGSRKRMLKRIVFDIAYECGIYSPRQFVNEYCSKDETELIFISNECYPVDTEIYIISKEIILPADVSSAPPEGNIRYIRRNTYYDPDISYYYSPDDYLLMLLHLRSVLAIEKDK